ncbi:MAG TPA: SLBB domain-containing protein [Ignavibacteriales bacterium]|nr:SLBB domain-containing protein [Ignavibacteriales bacterium]
MRKGVMLFVAAFIAILVSDACAQTAYYKIENEGGELMKKVNIWGYVKNPGRYEVPASTNLVQMIAYAGGPRDHALMDEVKVFRDTQTGGSIIKEINVEEPSKVRQTDLQILDEDTIVIDHSSAVTIGEIFSFIGAPVAIVTSLILIADRLGKK